MSPQLTVTIIAKNEEEAIAAAVRSGSWADEVLVLDSGSGDTTVERAHDAGARVVVEPWRGYGAQKNRAAELARTDWILSLDADERCSVGMATSIAALPAKPDAVAFAVRRLNRFAGRPIRRWPWSWDWTTRLYDRRRARFSNLAVHESLQVDGPVGKIGGYLDHDTYSGWEDHFKRQLVYASLGAQDAAQRAAYPRLGDITFRPVATFFRHFIVRGYLLNGVLGWRLSRMAARYTWMKYLVLEDLAHHNQPVRHDD